MRIHCANPEDTHRLGRAIGEVAEPGLVIALNGSLGAGKTSLAQGIAVGLEISDEYYVNSPTFTILQLYPGRHQLAHMDWYRIADEDEAMGLGLEEYLCADFICVVEWPERLTGFIPDDHLQVDIHMALPGRDFELCAAGPHSQRALDNILRKWAE